MKLTDLSTSAVFENPYPLYEKIRAEGAFIPLSPDVWLTGRYAVANALLHDRRVGKSYMEGVAARYGETAREEPAFKALSRTFLMMNPPTHTRLRALLTKGFNARQIEKLRDVSQVTADALIDAIAPDSDFDLMKDYASPLPLAIICRLLDVPVEDGLALGSATHRMMQVLEAAPVDATRLATSNAATLTLERYFLKVIETRRTQPGKDDLVSALIRAEEAGESLTDDEIVSNLILLFAAGHETTSNMLGNALIALYRHPEQLLRLRREPSLMPAAISECIRYDSSVHMVTRVALEDLELAGQSLPRGSTVFILVGSANRDPSQFERPDELDIGRNAQGRMLSFSAGIHYCVGARLALLELEVGLGTLLSRLPSLRLTRLDTLKWQKRNTLRGVVSLMATC
jgi:cytochrome P450